MEQYNFTGKYVIYVLGNIRLHCIDPYFVKWLLAKFKSSKL